MFRRRKYRRRPMTDELLARIRRITDKRGSYGYRRVTALVNRELIAEGKPTVNHKRMYRVMRDHQLLLHKHTGKKSTRTRDGQVITPALEHALVLGQLRRFAAGTAKSSASSSASIPATASA